MPIAPTRRCEFCGYDLRGITSEACPECGQSKTVALRFDDSEHYHRARAALEQHGLLVSFVNAGLASEIVYASAKVSGWLRVGSTNLDRVITVLDDIGVMWTEEGLATVFRDEPSCPKCARDLRDEAGPACPDCGSPFQWADVDLADAAPDQEIVCHACFQDVIMVNGRCPKCGAAEATAAAEPHSDSSAKPKFSPALWVACAAGFTIPVLCVMFQFGITRALDWFVLWALVLSGAMAAWFMRKR